MIASNWYWMVENIQEHNLRMPLLQESVAYTNAVLSIGKFVVFEVNGLVDTLIY